MVEDLKARIERLARLMYESRRMVVFTGAGISTESGLPDFRGPDGMWTRQAKGLAVEHRDFSKASPNAGHMAVLRLQQLGKLTFLISQNVDNLHLKSGIQQDLLAELHGNITKVRCRQCEFTMDNFGDQMQCPECGGDMAPSVVNFGQSLPRKDLALAYEHSQRCDLFIVVGSSLVVFPAADMPKVAIEHGATLVILNQGETPMDEISDLRFHEQIGAVLPPAVARLEDLIAGRS